MTATFKGVELTTTPWRDGWAALPTLAAAGPLARRCGGWRWRRGRVRRARRASPSSSLAGCGAASRRQPAVGRRRAGRSRPRHRTPTTSSAASTTRGSPLEPGTHLDATRSPAPPAGTSSSSPSRTGPRRRGRARPPPARQHRADRRRRSYRLLRPGPATATCGGSAGRASGRPASTAPRPGWRCRRPRGSATATGAAYAPGVVEDARDGRLDRPADDRAGRDVRRPGRHRRDAPRSSPDGQRASYAARRRPGRARPVDGRDYLVELQSALRRTCGAEPVLGGRIWVPPSSAGVGSGPAAGGAARPACWAGGCWACHCSRGFHS